MFSSGGYFRSVNCPFFVHGLCHRPYCHFRHAKPGHGSTSKNNAIKSCFKSKTAATATPKSASQGSSSSKSLQTSANKETVFTKPLDLKPDVPVENSLANNTTFLSNNKDPAVQQQPKEQEKDNDLPQMSKKTSSILDSLNKLEQAVDEASASLLVHSSVKNLNFMVNNNSKDSKAILLKTLSANTTNDDLKTQEASRNLDSETTKQENNTKDTQSTSKCEDTCINASTQSNHHEINCSEIEPSHSNKEIPTKKQLSSIDQDLEMCNEIIIKDITEDLTGTRPTSVLKETMPSRKTTAQDKELLVVTKKRKSLEIFDVDVKKAKIKKYNSQGASVMIESKELTSISKHPAVGNLESKELTSISKDPSVENLESKELTSISKHPAVGNLEKCKESNVRKNKIDDCDKQNSALKQKPKSEIKILDIDFFTSPKKAKQSKVELKEKGKTKKEDKKMQKSDNRLKMSSKKSDTKSCTKQILKHSEQKERKCLASKSKISENVKKKSPVPLTTSLFESEDEVRFSSDSLSGSDSETDAVDSSTEMLREIFDNYDPKEDLALTPGSTKKGKATAIGMSVLSSTATSPAKDKIKTADLQGFIKKPRVAHDASYLVQRKSNNLNPVRRIPKTIPSSSSASPQKQSSLNEYNVIESKKRIAHQPRPSSQSSSPRPRIPIEYGAKVPQSFRQRYLDKIIDENLRLCSSENEAFEKAVEEERNLYNRSARRHIYLNLCINAIKNLRSQPTPEHQSESILPQMNMTAGTTDKHGISHSLSTTPVNTKSPKKIDTEKLTEEKFYDLMSQYVLTEEELVENGFPRTSLTTPGKVTFKSRKTTTTPNKDPNCRICCRCGRPYTVLEDGTYLRQEECVYHVGRLLKRRTAGEVTSTYSCCGSDGATSGCAVGKVHVSEGKNATEGFMTTIVSPLAGNQKKVFAIDCEMCYTIAGLELTRATVVDWKLDKVYDTFVKPDHPVLDYNTRFSGVTKECLRGVKTSIREVQAVLLSMIHRDSILVGHSLESDLLALKLVHSTIVDTSVVFPHRLGLPYKRALRTLTAEYLKRIIQDDEAGHDSQEDAKASLELMLYKTKEDWKKKERNRR